MFGEAKKSWKLWKLLFVLVVFVFVACRPPAEENNEEETQSSEKPQCNLSDTETLQKDVAQEAKISCTNIGSLYQGKKLKVQYDKDLVSVKVYKEDGKVDTEPETGSLILILDKKADFEKKVQVKGLKLGSSKVTGKVLSARFNADLKVVPASLSSPSSPSGSPSSPSSPSDSPSGSAPSSPSQPTAVKASATTITVSWSAATGATSYEVYSDTNSGGSFSSKVGTVNSGTTHTDTATRGATYYYKVKACNAAGCSSLSVASAGVNLPGAVSKPNAPSKPTVAKASAATITVSWSAATGATTYEVYRDTSSGGSFSSKVGTVNSGTTYTDTVSQGSTYYYKVKACNVAGCSAKSSASAGMNLIAAPAKPAHPSVTKASSSSIQVSWIAVSGATSYKLYRSVSSGGVYSQLGGSITGTSKTDTGLSAGTYYYKLVACNSAGCSNKSDASTAMNLIAVPTGLSFTYVIGYKIQLDWIAVSGATSYKLYREVYGVSTQIGGDVTSTSHTDTVNQPAEYKYSIKACDSVGCSSISNQISIRTFNKPALLTGVSFQSGIKLTWGAVSNASVYLVTLDNGSTRITNNTSFMDTSAKAGNNQYYVQACNAAKTSCSYSASINVTRTK